MTVTRTNAVGDLCSMLSENGLIEDFHDKLSLITSTTIRTNAVVTNTLCLFVCLLFYVIATSKVISG